MNKYTRVILVLFILGAVAVIIFRPSGKLMSGRHIEDKSIEDKNYLEIYDEAINNHKPILIEFYGRY
ncbi:MAG: hypothetical protein ACOX4H_11715 [Bacillota bacterium]|nr:hypothetical protein [Clostridia bacterium]